jgi:hypothetical protein
MTEHEKHVASAIGIKPIASAEYSEATFQRVVEDAIFFSRKSMEENCGEGDKKRYARMAIILTAFYLESLSHYIFEKMASKPLEDNAHRSDLPEAIRKFGAVHKEYFGKELTINIDGIRDIFYICNHIIAHPAGRTRLQASDVGWTTKDKCVSYKKFTSFPFAYSHFTLEHANIVLSEARTFVTELLTLIKDKVDQKLLKEWWPEELDKWSQGQCHS